MKEYLLIEWWNNSAAFKEQAQSFNAMQLILFKLSRVLDDSSIGKSLGLS